MNPIAAILVGEGGGSSPSSPVKSAPMSLGRYSRSRTLLLLVSGALSPVHTSNNVEATLSNATSWTILSTLSKGRNFVRHCCRLWQQSRTLLRQCCLLLQHCCWCGRGLRRGDHITSVLHQSRCVMSPRAWCTIRYLASSQLSLVFDTGRRLSTIPHPTGPT